MGLERSTVKLILAYRHYKTYVKLFGIYTDINRARRAVMQDDCDPNKVVFQEFEVNDGVMDEKE